MRSEIPIVVLDNTGHPIQNAQVQINVRGGAIATVYALEVGGATLTNPLTTDPAGRASGWLERGPYDAVISATGMTTYVEQFESVPSRDGAIDTAWIADGAVTTAKLADSSVTAQKIVAGAVSSAAPSGPAGGALAGTYPSPTLAANAVQTASLVDLAVTSAKLADSAVTSAKVLDGSLAAGDTAAGQFLGASNLGGTTFPTSGLFNGYRYTIFFANPSIGGYSAYDFVWRSDLDGTYPWHCTGGPPLHVAFSGSAPSDGGYNYYNLSGSASLPRTGWWNFQGYYYGDVANGGGGAQAQILCGGTLVFYGLANNNEKVGFGGAYVLESVGASVHAQGNSSINGASYSGRIGYAPIRLA
jgi:hypothetical protein